MVVLVLGAAGYIGGRLVPELLTAGHDVRSAVRSPRKLEARVWRGQVEVLGADVTVPSDMDRACDGADVVVYLLRDVVDRPYFVDRKRAGAAVVRDAAAAAGIDRIAYLGELGDAATSVRVAQRLEIGRVLADGPCRSQSCAPGHYRLGQRLAPDDPAHDRAVVMVILPLDRIRT